MSKIEYHACGGCRKEFYSDEEFYNHPCMKKDGISNGDPRGLARKSWQQGMLNELTSHSQKQDVLAHIASTGEQDPAVLNGILDANANTDSRLRSVQELKQMKHALCEVGIQCNTLNEEQTRQAYQEHVIAKPDAVSNDAPAAPTSKTTPADRRGRKSKQ